MRRLSLFTALILLSGCSVFGMSSISDPISRASWRDTPLSFGLYVTPDPETNPIDPPERFTGYHSGLDFEISSSEAEKEVPVFAACDGEVVYSGFAEGYGGLLVHRCVLDGKDVTVLYGHLKVDSLVKIGVTVKTGGQIGILGDARSQDTDGNRKHLHFAIHKGTDLSYLGYVQEEKDLEEYIDPESVLP